MANYLAHILEAIKRIYHYTKGITELAFSRPRLVQDAVIRNFEIIGKASRNIHNHYPDFAKAHPDVPLTFAYEMRNAMAHGYLQGRP